MIYQDNQTGCEYFRAVDLAVIDARCVITDETWKREGVRSSYSRLYYVKRGGGRLVCGEEEIIMQPGRMYLIPTETDFSHYPAEQMDKLFFHFRIPEPNGFDLLRGVGRIKHKGCGEEHIKELYRLFGSLKFSDAFALKGLVMRDIQTLVENEPIGDGRFSDYSEEVRAAIERILASPGIWWSVAALARELYVSESFLAKRFKKEVGLTVGDYIDRLVMQEAKLLLSETDESIASIAVRFGFCDRFYFSRRFKLLSGETPYAYRVRMQLFAD